MYISYKLLVLSDKIPDNIIRNVETWEEKHCKYLMRYIKIHFLPEMSSSMILIKFNKYMTQIKMTTLEALNERVHKLIWHSYKNIGPLYF